VGLLVMAKRKEDNLTEEERYLLSTIQQQPSRLAAHSIKSLVNRLVSERGYAAVQGGEVVREAWDCVVGKEIAAQTKPGNLRAGTLHIHVADSLTLQELHFRKKQILQKLQQVNKDLRISDLKFKLSGH
jgi:predicted nucleic acid-binding Zn ribbon protein